MNVIKLLTLYLLRQMFRLGNGLAPVSLQFQKLIVSAIDKRLELLHGYGRLCRVAGLTAGAEVVKARC